MKKSEDSSIRIGKGNKFEGDTAIGKNATISKNTEYNKSPHFEKSKIENVNINYGTQNRKSTVYKGDIQNVFLYEIFSPILIKKYGERKLGITGIISLVVGIIQLLIWMNSFTSTKIFGYLPKVSENLGQWFLWIGIIFFVVGAFLIGVLVYFRESKCKKCGRLFAYYECERPDVEEVKAHDGIHITTERKYECKYCGDKQVIPETEIKEYNR